MDSLPLVTINTTMKEKRQHCEGDFGGKKREKREDGKMRVLVVSKSRKIGYIVDRSYRLYFAESFDLTSRSRGLKRG